MNRLSGLRRETGMELKINKKETENLREEFDLAESLTVEIEESTNSVKGQCSV